MKNINIFKLKLLIILEFFILIIILIIVSTSCGSSEYKSVKNSEKTHNSAADDMSEAETAKSISKDGTDVPGYASDDYAGDNTGAAANDTADGNQDVPDFNDGAGDDRGGSYSDNDADDRGDQNSNDNAGDREGQDFNDNAGDREGQDFDGNINGTGNTGMQDTGNNDLLQYRVTRNGALGIDYPIVSDYGPRESLIEGMSTDHKGIDFGMDLWTELVAPYNVVVAAVGYNEYRGNWVIMYWKAGYYILYQHMSEIDVWEGEYLAAGDRVGFSGETGVSVIPHLHLEILVSYDGYDSVTDFEDAGLRVNPYYYIFDNDSYQSIY